MKAFILTSFVPLSLIEISELIKVKGKKIGSGIIEVEGTKSKIIKLCSSGQSFKRVLLSLDKVKDLKKIDWSNFSLKDYFQKENSYKIEMEGVRGQENRIALGKDLGTKLFKQVKKELGFDLELDFKKPEVVVYLYFDGQKYFLGIDLIGYDLTKRPYRVFVNSASFKGDLGYYLVRQTGFVKGEKLIVGFIKDGTTLIEAGLFASSQIVNSKFSLEKLPLFEKLESKNGFKKIKEVKKVSGFDESMMNIRAAKKNASIAKLGIQVSKFSLDELDVKFKEKEIHRLVFQITKKDEDKLNEIYYQANYVLKKKGTLLMVGRASWEISISEKFKLVSKEVIKRGTSGYGLWLLEKK